jgi:hypothetical protein
MMLETFILKQEEIKKCYCKPKKMESGQQYVHDCSFGEDLNVTEDQCVQTHFILPV